MVSMVLLSSVQTEADQVTMVTAGYMCVVTSGDMLPDTSGSTSEGSTHYREPTVIMKCQPRAHRQYMRRLELARGVHRAVTNKQSNY